MKDQKELLSWGVYTKVSEYMSSLDKGSVDYYIGMVLLQKLRDFPDIYIEEIAFLANTTKSSVAKFCHKIGYSSFSELKNDTSYYGEDYFFSWFNDNRYPTKEGYLDALAEADHRMMSTILDSLNEERLMEAAEAIRGSRRVLFLASEYNKNIVSIFGEILMQKNIILTLISRDNSDQEILNAVKSADTVLMSSLSGSWIEQRRQLVEQIDSRKPFYIISKMNAGGSDYERLIWPIHSPGLRRLGSFYETQRFLLTVFLMLNYYILKKETTEEDI